MSQKKTPRTLPRLRFLAFIIVAMHFQLGTSMGGRRQTQRRSVSLDATQDPAVVACKPICGSNTAHNMNFDIDI